MKRIIIFFVSALLPATAFSQGFDMGDCKAGLGVGVGTIKGCGATFDQHFNMDWGVGKIGDLITVGVGFSVNNSYGATVESAVIGSYDYYYTLTTYYNNNVMGKGTSTSRQHRKNDYCTAGADASREDVNALFTTSFYYSPIANLDVYIKVGLGVGVMNYIISNIHNEQGLQKVNHDNTLSSGTRTVYQYDDYKHVKWNGYASKACVAFSAFAGATYWLSSYWGAEVQFGLLSSNLKTGIGGYNGQSSVLSLGAVYRF